MKTQGKTIAGDGESTGGTTIKVQEPSLFWSLAGNFAALVCTVLGAGMLSMPSNLYQSGWILGSIIIIGFAAAASYAIYGLTKVCVDVKDKDDSFHCTYPNLGRYVLGCTGEYAIVLTQHLTLILVGTLFVVLGGASLQQLFEEGPNPIYTMYKDDPSKGHQMWMIIFWAVAAVPPILLRGMKDINWLVMVGGAASVVVGISTVIAALVLPDDVEGADTSTRIGPENFSGVISSLAAVSFAFGAATEAPLLVAEASKKQRQYIPMVSAGALTFVAVMYLLCAWVGYAKFGESLKSANGNILDRLPYGAPTVVGVVLIIIHVLGGYSVILQPVLVHLERLFGFPDPYASSPVSTDSRLHRGESFKMVGMEEGEYEQRVQTVDDSKITARKLSVSKKMMSILVRFLACGVTLFLAEALPFFGDLLNLIGAFTATACCFYIPYILYMKRFWKVLPLWEKGLLVLLILLALLVTVAGTVVAIQGIVASCADYHLF